MNTEFMRILHKFDINLTHEEIRDILWLGTTLETYTQTRLNNMPDLPEKTSLNTSSTSLLTDSKSKLQQNQPLQTNISEKDRDALPNYIPTANLHQPSVKDSTVGKGKGYLTIRTPAANALPDSLELARSLRPLMRRIASRVRVIHDTTATVRRICDENIWMPVLRPARSRWFDIALVIDDSQSMLVWQDTLRELQRLLERHGAFRAIRIWRFRLDSDGSLTLRLGHDPVPRPMHALLDSSRRQLILIASDCLSKPWFTGQLAEWIRTWSSVNPVSLVHMLPQTLWRRTALRTAPLAQFYTSVAGNINRNYHCQTISQILDINHERIIHLPILTLEPESFRLWAKLTTGVEKERMGGVLLPIGVASPDPQKIQGSLRSRLSPIAQMLAGYLACTAPLILPVMRLVQQTMLPHSHQSHLAEVLMSGVLSIVPGQKLTQPNNIIYKFESGVDEELREFVPLSKAGQVLETISSYISSELGRPSDFDSILDASSTDSVFSETIGRPFATIAATILERFGGELSTYAASLMARVKQNNHNVPSGSIIYSNQGNSNYTLYTRQQLHYFSQYGKRDLSDLLNNFTGRQNEIAHLGTLISHIEYRGGYVIIYAKNGEGKSSIIAKMIENQGINSTIYCFIDNNKDFSHYIKLINSLISQLIIKHNISLNFYAEDTYLDACNHLRMIFQEISQLNVREIIYIDGLDNLQEISTNNTNFPLSNIDSFHIEIDDVNPNKTAHSNNSMYSAIDISFLPQDLPSGITIILNTASSSNLKLLDSHLSEIYELPSLSLIDFQTLLKSHGLIITPIESQDIYTILEGNAANLTRSIAAIKKLSNSGGSTPIKDWQSNTIVKSMCELAIEQNQWQEAVYLCQKTKQWEILHNLLINRGERLRATGGASDLVQWLELVRPHSFSADAELLLVRSQAAMGDFAGALLTSAAILSNSPAPEHIRAIHLIQANIEQARGDIAAADALVRPYLHDSRLEPLDRARALRIHGIAQSTQGNDDAALLSLEEACGLARGGGPSRLLAMAFGDCGNVAARLGRYILAERYLELAERTWVALGSPPDIAVVLNMRAVVMLHTNRLDEAAAQAEASYVRAIDSDRRRGAAAALATRGDIAVVQGDWTTADLRYRAAVDLAHTTHNTAVMLYAQALRTFAATALGDSASLTALLDAVSQAPAEAALDNAWMVVAKVACRLGLRLNGGLPALAEAREGLGPHSSLVHGLLTLLAAAAAWVNDDHAQAAAEWRALDELLLEGRGGVPMLLGPIARLYPAVLNAAYHLWHSPSAQRFLAAQTALPADEPRLTARLLGQIQLIWQAQPVTLPRHGPELLALLLLAGPEGMTADLLRSRLWGEDEETISRWNKMLQRVRKALPDCISFENGRYKLAVRPHELDADLLRVYSTPLADGDETDLRQAAAYAALPLLPASDQPWVIGERERISRRGAELWLAVGALDQDRQRTDAAIAAYQTAVRLHPLHERATMALISARLERGERADAINAYLGYRQLLDESLGLDPAAELELLYQRALHAST